MVTSYKDHGRNWLRGRPGQSSSSAVPSDNNYVNELTAKIKHDLERELEARLNIKVQENMTMMLKRLGNANPDLKLDLGDFCPTISSEQDDTDTPLTGGTADQLELPIDVQLLLFCFAIMGSTVDYGPWLNFVVLVVMSVDWC